MRLLCNLLILLTILFAASFSEAKVSKQVLSKKQSVVTIYIEDNKKTIAFGSGFIIDVNGLVVTNYHVIAPWKKSKTAKLLIKKSDQKFLTPVEIVATDEDKDVAIIKVKETGLPAIKLAKKYKPAQGESVVVIGSPLGFETTVTDGIVSGIRGEDGFVQITAPIAQGSSGSPVLNTNGDAIGVATLLINDAQNLNFAIPVSYVEGILSKPVMEKAAKSNANYPSPRAFPINIAEDLKIKMAHIPPNSIRWGIATNELKKIVNNLNCEKDGSVLVCDSITPDLTKVSFAFENDKLVSFATMVMLPKSDPDSLTKEFSVIQVATGSQPRKREGENKYLTALEFSRCTSSIKNTAASADALFTYCEPGLYLRTYINDPAKEPFKLLDFILGQSTQEEIIATCKANNWKYWSYPYKNEIQVSIGGIKLDGIYAVELFLVDNVLESVKYGIDKKYADKGAFFKLLKSKYGQQRKDKDELQANYYAWDVNKDTRDAVSVVMSFDSKPENVTSISYSLVWLAQRKLETQFHGFRKQSDKTQDLKSRAF
jgi:hypothetical protein